MSEDVTITLEAAIVRLSALEVRSLLRMQQQTRRWGELQAANPWAYNIWETGSKVGALQARAVLYCPPPAFALAGSAASSTHPPMQCCITDQPANAVVGSARPCWRGPVTGDSCHESAMLLMFSSSAHASSTHQAVLV